MKNLKDRAIIKYKGNIGRVIVGTLKECAGKFLFYPAGKGQYWQEQLEKIDPEHASETTLEEKIIYLKMENTWGKVENVHIINNGEYIIFEVQHKNTTRKLYHTYLNFEGTSRAYEKLDAAIIGLLGHKYQGNNSQAGCMFERMLQMNEGKKIEVLG